MLERLTSLGVIESLNEIIGVGHRVVHGGEIFNESVLITDELMEKIDSLSELAPLHNPANITGIKEFQKALPSVPEIAVFDTAFHQTMPESSFLYSLPYEYYEKYGIRKYGFHGSSHKYVSERAAEMLGAHLNNCVLFLVTLEMVQVLPRLKVENQLILQWALLRLLGLQWGQGPEILIRHSFHS